MMPKGAEHLTTAYERQDCLALPGARTCHIYNDTMDTTPPAHHDAYDHT